MKPLLIVSLLALSYTSQAQLGGLKNRIKSKVENRINNKVDNAIDRTLDGVEGKNKNNNNNNSGGGNAKAKTTNNDAAAEEQPAKKEAKSTLVSYSKFDFVPGEKVIYAEDFAQDVVGEIPVSWNASGKGEVRTLQGQNGKWLRLFQNITYLTGNTKQFGENFTMEFDMVYFFEPKVTGYLLPNATFGLFCSGTEETTDNDFLHGQAQYNYVGIEIHPYGEGTSRLHSSKKGVSSFSSDRVSIGTNYQENFSKVLHYSIQVQKTRLRMWVNESKVFDIPRAVNLGDTLNQIFFKMESSNYKDDEVGLFLTNLKVATGLPDTRHKLIEEGKFSTTGILFDFQSAVIKPESFGVIKEITDVLKENGSVKIEVVGHTSSDGDDAANMKLSKQRAAAVKDLMVKQYGIDEARLQTEGKGETQPVGDNKTKEGKAQNRRVEFIKM